MPTTRSGDRSRRICLRAARCSTISTCGPTTARWIASITRFMWRAESKARRHILVDTLGLLLHAIVHPADIQDRDGGILLLATLFGMYPFLKKLFADGGYQGPEFQKALAKILP